MARGGRSLVGTALGAVVASFLVVVWAPAADAAVCTLGWTGEGDHESWFSAQNWGGIGTPGFDDVVCITTTDHVVNDASVSHVGEMHFNGSTEVEVRDGSGIIAEAGEHVDPESVWGPDTNVFINNNGVLGGSGTIRVQGGLWASSPATGSVLESGNNGNGTMIVEGSATVVANGLGLADGYQLDVPGRLVLQPGTWLAANPGTGATIAPGGTFELTGDGGFYQGGGAGTPSFLVNNGTLVKTGGTGTSVIDATYQGTGQIQVQTGAVALPDSGQVGATVWPGSGLATGRCGGPVSTAVCQPTQDPAQDTMSVSLTVPGANAGPAAIQLQELGPVSPAVDPAAVGNEVLAHADNLTPGQPARVDLRFSQADVMATPLDQVQVVHTTDAGFDVLLPDCANGTLPAGLFSCVVRPVDPYRREHLRVGAHHDDQSVAPPARPDRREPRRRHRAAGAGGEGGGARRLCAGGHVVAAGIERRRNGHVVRRGPRRQGRRDAGGHHRGVEEPRPRSAQDHRGRPERRWAGDGRGRVVHAGRAVQAAEGRRAPGGCGREADRGREVEGPGQRGRLHRHQVQAHGPHRGREEGRRRGRQGRQAEVPLHAEARPLRVQGPCPQLGPLGSVEQADRCRPTPLTPHFD